MKQNATWQMSNIIISTNELTEIQIGDFSIKNSGSEKLLGVSK